MRNPIRGEYSKSGGFKTLPVLPWIVICAAVSWMFLRADTITGDQFRRLYHDSLNSTLGVWYLYREDDDSYCVRTPRPPWPDKRYCVPKTDIEVNKEPGEPIVGYIYSDELILKAERFPGAKREAF